MKKKPSALKSVNRWYARALKEGRLTNPPLFWRKYDQLYPELRQLEAAYPAIRAECLELLKRHESIPGIETLGGNYTAGGIHTIQWKSFLLKLGSFVNENCQLCPRTTEALKGIPEVYLAFFSILSPRQYIKPHFGYYKGFLRYHLGVLSSQRTTPQTLAGSASMTIRKPTATVAMNASARGKNIIGMMARVSSSTTAFSMMPATNLMTSAWCYGSICAGPCRACWIGSTALFSGRCSSIPISDVSVWRRHCPCPPRL